MPGLSVSDVVNVQVNLAPVAVPVRNFGTLLIAGSSDVIDVNERLREYVTLTAIGNDFGTDSPEFRAADLYFSQSPRPALVYIGRFAQNGSAGVLHGGLLTAAAQAQLLNSLKNISDGTMTVPIDGTPRVVAASPGTLHSAPFSTTAQDTLVTTLQGITSGGFKITVDTVVEDTGAIDFSAITDLADAEDLINTALDPEATFEWDSKLGQFVVKSASTGATSTLTYASAPATGTDISASLQLTAASGALAPAPGGTGMDFSDITNLNGAAAILGNALVGAKAWFDGRRFHIQSLSAGDSSTVGFASGGGTGVDVSGLFRLTSGTALPPVDGILGETPLEAVTALRAHPEWYGFMFALEDDIPVADHVSVAQFIEQANPNSIYGYTTQDTQVLESTISNDIASQLQALTLQRTFGQYSSFSPYAVAAIFGRAFTVDFQGTNTMITLKFKQEPGVAGERLTENDARVLRNKSCNVFVFYSNDVAIIQEGVMANGYFFDEVQGMDWLANQVQTDLFNTLYTSTAKIPQTNQGVHVLVTTVVGAMQQGVANGLIAPGFWNAPGFGQLSQGQMLAQGYYVWAPAVETQPQSVREQRIAPTIQAAVKLAGAVHFANCIINVNR
jgi:hypothetical protein